MKIAIAGYGVEGKTSYHYFKAKGNDVVILDNRDHIEGLPEEATALLGEAAFQNLEQYDLVIRTPSLNPQVLAAAKKIWSATNEFFARCPAPIIGVTGTKGKGTTCSLIAAMLREAGKTVHLVGNIGVPALDVLPDIQASDIVVYELSSFQLWDLEQSPHIAVILMVEPDHLNVHADFDDYVAAKAHITQFQHEDDVVIFHPTNTESAAIAQQSKAKVKQRYLTKEAAYIEDGMVMINEVTICATKDVGIRGEYNLQNVCAALSCCWQLTQDIEALARVIKGFKGLEHRLEFVATKQGVDFYNDSYSSAPTATMAAISAFKTPLILIVGGYDRGIDLHPLAEAIKNTASIKQVVVIGEIRERLAQALHQAGYANAILSDGKTMQEIVQSAQSSAEPGDTILLSPGCASFDMFTNFSERGEQFKKAVEAIDG